MAAGALGVLILIIGFIVGIFVIVGVFGSWVASMALAFVVISGLLMMVILVQQPKGGGLAGAFGGSGGSQGAVMGAKAGDMLTYATVVLFVLFLGTLLGLTAVIRAQDAAFENTTEITATEDGEGESADREGLSEEFDSLLNEGTDGWQTAPLTTRRTA